MLYHWETTCCFSPTPTCPKSQGSKCTVPQPWGRIIYFCLGCSILQPRFQLLPLHVALTERAGNSGTVWWATIIDATSPGTLPALTGKQSRTPLLYKYGLIFVCEIPSSPQPPKSIIHLSFLQTQFSLVAFINWAAVLATTISLALIVCLLLLHPPLLWGGEQENRAAGKQSPGHLDL